MAELSLCCGRDNRRRVNNLDILLSVHRHRWRCLISFDYVHVGSHTTNSDHGLASLGESVATLRIIPRHLTIAALVDLGMLHLLLLLIVLRWHFHGRDKTILRTWLLTIVILLLL